MMNMMMKISHPPPLNLVNLLIGRRTCLFDESYDLRILRFIIIMLVLKSFYILTGREVISCWLSLFPVRYVDGFTEDLRS